MTFLSSAFYLILMVSYIEKCVFSGIISKEQHNKSTKNKLAANVHIIHINFMKLKIKKEKKKTFFFIMKKRKEKEEQEYNSARY